MPANGRATAIDTLNIMSRLKTAQDGVILSIKAMGDTGNVLGINVHTIEVSTRMPLDRTANETSARRILRIIAELEDVMLSVRVVDWFTGSQSQTEPVSPCQHASLEVDLC